MNEVEIARKYPGIDVRLNEDYRLVADPYCFIVLRRHTVDPTAAANWSKRVEEAEANGQPPPDPTPRVVWREDGYFSLTANGLRHAIEYTVMQAARQSEARAVTELFEFIRRENGAIFQRISRQLLGGAADD